MDAVSADAGDIAVDGNRTPRSTMNTSTSDVPELPEVPKRSDTAIVLACYVTGATGHICQQTSQRWMQYAAHHSYDTFVLRTPSAQPSWSPGIAAAPWDKVVASIELLTSRGYEWVLQLDGDTMPIRWEWSVHDLVRRAGTWTQNWGTLTSSELRDVRQNCSILLSRDSGHMGFSAPPNGPHNSGILLLRRSTEALELLEYVRSKSTRSAWRHWPYEQGPLNNWLHEQPSSRYASIRHGRMVVGTLWPRSQMRKWPINGSWTAEIERALRSTLASKDVSPGPWILHMAGWGGRNGDKFAQMMTAQGAASPSGLRLLRDIVSLVNAVLPIGNASVGNALVGVRRLGVQVSTMSVRSLR
jgi:hypothetical protein